MKQESDQSAERQGLLANGSSGRWTVDINESLDRDEWSMEIKGPQTYLVFQLPDLKAVPEALRFLQAKLQRGPNHGRHEWSVAEDTLTLGCFGAASVSLVCDNEDFVRCFITIGPKDQSTLRLSLYAEDIQMLVEALAQVVNDLPQEGGA